MGGYFKSFDHLLVFFEPVGGLRSIYPTNLRRHPIERKMHGAVSVKDRSISNRQENFERLTEIFDINKNREPWKNESMWAG